MSEYISRSEELGERYRDEQAGSLFSQADRSFTIVSDGEAPAKSRFPQSDRIRAIRFRVYPKDSILVICEAKSIDR